MIKKLSWALVFFAVVLQTAQAQYELWQHSGNLTILTTPEGANLSPSAEVHDFPLLVRLDRDWFDFGQAKPNGDDIRFSAGNGAPLRYQIDEWDAAKGTASIWVRIPRIRGNERQEITLHWGSANAASESMGAGVFNADNGYVSVLHMDRVSRDELGAITPGDQGTTAGPGIIGRARHLIRGRGILGGDHITNYPSGDGSFTSEAWFRPELAGTTIFYWGRYATRLNGNTGDGNEVALNIGAPASLGWASDGPGGVSAATVPVLGQWNHVAATYENGTSRIYVNGRLDGIRYHKAAMSIVKDIVVSIGGMRGTDFRFVGDIDEVRVSRVARSADWMQLQYENEKPMQSLVGPIQQTGSEFSISHTSIRIQEDQNVAVSARAGGAQKIYWVLKKDGIETLAAVDRFSFNLAAGRVTNDTSMTLQFRAIFANGTQTRDIPVNVIEDIPEPIVTLKAPTRWNGREAIEIIPTIENLAAMRAKGAGTVKTTWTVSGGAVIQESTPEKLVLKRSQFTGRINVQAAVNNGGADSIAVATIQVTEPDKDAWVQRTPEKDERPEDNQFYARDDKNEGMLFYNGRLNTPSDTVFLKLYADDTLLQSQSQKPGADQGYSFTAKLKAGLIKYRVEFGISAGGLETVLQTATNLICGDAYIIDGQSNAEATGPNNGNPPESEFYTSDWIRSYGNQLLGTTQGGWGTAVRTHRWGSPEYGNHQIGTWGMVLASNLLTRYQTPVCIINGAYGGTPIFQHQPNPTNHFDSSGDFYENPHKIYGCLLSRVTAARLTHGIRGVLWHQGENDSGSGAPTGDWNYKSYRPNFLAMAAAWKQDYPNIQHYYVFQVWPLPCSMGPMDDEIREVQRTLPRLFSNLRVMSTIGIAGPRAGRGWCHFDLEDYARFAMLMSPVVEIDNYGLIPGQEVTAPNLRRAWFTTSLRDEIALDFGQLMTRNDDMKTELYLDNQKAPVSTGTVAGNIIKLQMAQSSPAKTITYLSGRDWEGKPASLIFGANGIAALTFSRVPVEAPSR
jgi:Concanavalin A-like lectin/glucanases superfamily/Domain of unknown function (DUF2341)/Carbohydrate esterase, sialic acid-specific acetylesterase